MFTRLMGYLTGLIIVALIASTFLYQFKPELFNHFGIFYEDNKLSIECDGQQDCIKINTSAVKQTAKDALHTVQEVVEQQIEKIDKIETNHSTAGSETTSEVQPEVVAAVQTEPEPEPEPELEPEKAQPVEENVEDNIGAGKSPEPITDTAINNNGQVSSTNSNIVPPEEKQDITDVAAHEEPIDTTVNTATDISAADIDTVAEIVATEEIKTHFFWSAFNSKRKADVFAKNIEKQSGVAVFVKQIGSGYSVYFNFASDIDKELTLETIQKSTGFKVINK
jgi:hypothetical protein